MSTVQFNLPDGVLAALRCDSQALTKEMREQVAAIWYAEGRLSQSRAAELAGLSRSEFLDMLARRGIEVFSVDLQDLDEELALG